MFKLKKLCKSPEEYDVFHNKKNVGSFKLEDGVFTVKFKGKPVYKCTTLDENVNYFVVEWQRIAYLRHGCEAIQESLFGPLYKIEL